VKNWGEYEAGLRRRGDLTVWLSDEALDDPRSRHEESMHKGATGRVQIGCKILNRMALFGMPDSCKVA
jgi:hypothetical protein